MIKHYWNGSILTVESDSGSSAADLMGPKGETGPRGPRGLRGERGGGAQIEDGIISTETTWSSAAIMDNFAEYMSVEGNPVQCEPIPNYPLHVITSFEAKQSGSGKPSPDNIRPIVGYDSINITRCGKNLYNSNNLTYGEPFFNSDGMAQTSTSVGVCYIPIEAGKTYTITAYSQHYIRVAQVDSDKAFISGVRFALQGAENGESRTFTTTTNTAYLQIAQDKSLVKAQLEEGETATAYEANGDTFTFALGSTYYGGMLDWNTGELIVNKKCVSLNGSEAWTQVSAATNGLDYYWYNIGSANTIKADENTQKCSHYVYGVVVSWNDIQNKFRIYTPEGGSYTRLAIRPDITKYSTIDLWKAYLTEQYNAGIPVQVVYELAEPQTIQLTAQEIKAIKGINTLYTNADNLQVIGRVDTMKQLSELAARVAALEKKLGGE